MPRPFNERQSLEQERAEIPGQIAAYRQELENVRPHKASRERLEWQIKEREKRLAEVEARLAAMKN
jgi:DNA repair exonuclease SbcCD ATPase subunit